jgi:dephospho-CoA kinase
MLRDRHGAELIDADALGHEAHADPGVHRLLVDRFGPGILDPKGDVDRKALSAAVFGDRGALADLNSIVHPWILRAIGERLAALRASGHAGIVVLDAALLPDWRGVAVLDSVIWIRCSEETALRRLRLRGLTEEEALRRLTSQAGEEAYRATADLIVENEGTLENLVAVADQLAADWTGEGKE